MLLEDMPYRQNSEITMDWSGNGLDSPGRIMQKFFEHAGNNDSDNEEIVPMDLKHDLGYVTHHSVIKAVRMDAYVAVSDDALPTQGNKDVLKTESHTRRFKLLSKRVLVKPAKAVASGAARLTVKSKNAVVKPAKAVASGAARLTVKSKNAVVKPAKAVASGAARLTVKSKNAVVKPAKAVASGAARLTVKSKNAVVKPAKVVGKAVSQASSAVTAKVRSIGSLFHGLRFPCLSKAECKA